MPRSSRHVLPTTGLPPQQRDGGSIIRVDAAAFPILRRMAMRRLLLAPLGLREPHWHPNAHELAYCIRGDALVTIFGNAGLHATFTIAAGEMFFVPSGFLHHIENVGSAEAEFVLAFSHEAPEDFGLSAVFGAMSDAVLGNTFDLPAAAFAGLKRSPADTLIGLRATPAVPAESARFPSAYKFAVEAMAAPIATPMGSAKTARKTVWPILDALSMFSPRIANTGMREPHWHPETAEMGYVLGGRARMTLLSPGADVDTYELQAGDVYFVPRGYPHDIENIGEEEVRILVFFDQAMPGDVGYTGAASAYSREVMAATLGCGPDQLPQLPFRAEDAMIVDRRNPVDP